MFRWTHFAVIVLHCIIRSIHDWVYKGVLHMREGMHLRTRGSPSSQTWKKLGCVLGRVHPPPPPTLCWHLSVSKNMLLATYRCQESVGRLEFSARTVEGQFGDVQV